MEAIPSLVVLALLTLGTAGWLWALADVLSQPRAARYRAAGRVSWVVVITLGHTAGAALYLLLGRPRRLR